MPSAHFPYTVGFRGVHGKRVFATPVELSNWVSGEHSAFRDFAIAKPSQNAEPYLSLSKAFRNLEAAKANAEKLVSLPVEDSQEFLQVFNAVNQNLSVAYQNKGLPPSHALIVNRLRLILEEEPQVALAALCAATSPIENILFAQLDPPSARGIGLVSALRFTSDDEGNTAALDKTVDSTIATINLRADETNARVVEQIRLADDAQQRAHQAWDTHNDDYSKLSASLKQKVDVEIEGANKAIADFKTAHQAEIALKEPVLFWERKGKAHQSRARRFAVVGLVTAFVLAIGAITQLPTLLSPVNTTATSTVVNLSTAPGATTVMPKPAPVPVAAPGSGAPSYYGIALAIVLTTLALWLLRILVRGYFSQTHLATDAEERVAMVKTYLALMESGKAPHDTLTPVLVALFRPASDGIVKDDSMPMGVAEFLTKPKSGS